MTEAKTKPRAKRSPAPQAANVPPPLAELQASFQRAVLAGDDEILSLIPPNSRTTREVLFGVYRNAYMGRLVEMIGNDHAYLKTYAGDEYFETMARAFITAHPSRTQNARWFAEGLPDFLSGTEPYAFNPQLGELARIERTLGFAFDAPEAPVVALAELQAIDPGDWERLVFIAHPSTRLLSLQTNALAMWAALRGDQIPPASERLDTPQKCLVWRQDVTPMVRPLPPEEAMMWTEAAKGVPFGQLCELLAAFDDPDTAPLRAAQILQGWLAAGVLTKAHVPVKISRAKRKAK
jgi:Putative DNA-binding domain